MKGQLTVPLSIRKKLGLYTGTQVVFLEREDGDVVIRAKKGNLVEHYGMLKGTGRPATIEEMDQAIADHVVHKYLHGTASDE